MRKVLVSLLVLAMVLGLVGPVSAAFTDVTASKYVDKVAAFGWMNGYPDGTFKSEGNITRAEASTVIVRALGLEAAAAAAKGLATKFADVPSDHWASGYINVCTTKGVLKGYPDGTFKPSANITGSEIITMIVRALNREYQAVGEWPIGHITVAAAEKIIGSGFVSNALATRGQVAEYVSKAAEVVFGELTSNGWTVPTTNIKTFAISSGFDLYTADPIQIDSVDTVEKTVNGNLKLADNYVIAGGTALKDILGYTCKLFMNEDDQVVLIEPTTKTTMKTGQLRLIGADYFYLYDDTTKYVLATGAEFYRNGVQKTYLSDLKVDDNVEFFRDTAGHVTVLKATVYDITHRTVLSVYTAGEQSTWSLRVGRGKTGGTVGTFEQGTYYLDNETIVMLDGQTVTLKEVKEDMVCSIQTDTEGGNLAKKINVSSKIVSGQVTSKRLMVDSVGDSFYYFTVGGTEYRLEGNIWIEDGTAYAAINVYNAIPINSQLTAVLSVRNRLGFITESTTAAQYGKVITFNAQEGSTSVFDKWIVDVKGVATTYEVGRQSFDGTSGPSWHGPLTTTYGIATNSYVKIVLDANNRITIGTTLAQFTVGPALVEEVFPADKLVRVAGSGYWSIGESAIVYIDGVYSSGIVGVAKDSMVQLVPKGVELKVDLLVVNTYARIDLSKIVAQQNGVVVGDGAVERTSTIEFYPTSAMTPGTKFSTTDSTLPYDVVTADQYGDFTCTVNVPGLPYGTPAGTTLTVYMKVISPMGMSSSASLKVYPTIGGVVQPTILVSPNPASINVAPGGAVQITTTCTPSDAAVTYLSLDPSKASVTSTGLVFGVSAGTTSVSITATKAGYTSGSVSVPVTVAPIGIATVQAANGSAAAVFNSAPAAPPVVGNFAVKQSINGGAAVDVAGLAYAWNATGNIAYFTFTPIAATGADQTVVITVSYLGGVAVAAPSFVVAAWTVSIESVAATNGTVDVVLNHVPTVAPVAGDFTFTTAINSGAAVPLTVGGFAWDNGTKTASFTFTAIAGADADQSVVVAASYKLGAAVAAPAFVVDGVKIASVAASNGTVTVTLNRVPSVAPVAGDFAFTIAKDAGADTPLTVGGFGWNATNKQAFFVFTPVSGAGSYVVKASYKGAAPVAAPAFVLP